MIKAEWTNKDALDVVSRQDAIDTIRMIPVDLGCRELNDAVKALNELPTVDAVPVEWLQTHIATIEQQRLLDEWTERKYDAGI